MSRFLKEKMSFFLPHLASISDRDFFDQLVPLSYFSNYTVFGEVLNTAFEKKSSCRSNPGKLEGCDFIFFWKHRTGRTGPHTLVDIF